MTHGAPTTPWKLRCVATGEIYAGDERRYRSESGGVLEVVHDFTGLERLDAPLRVFADRRASTGELDRSGVWRFRELVLPLDPSHIVSRGEGNTTLYRSKVVSDYCRFESVLLKHEGENPTGSFKDRGMTTGVSMAKRLGATAVACASTGNTSASMASFAAIAGMRAIVFIPEGNIAFGKLSQALAYGARTIQIKGNFDDAMRLVEDVCNTDDIYLLNSLNPFRLEGQKAIALEILDDLGWRVPDWIVCPGGNLGNSSAMYKALRELHELELIDTMPRIAVVQAEGASPLYKAFADNADDFVPIHDPETIATAIRIGSPVSFPKSLDAVRRTGGVVERVSDQEIMDAKAIVDRAGIGCEPASAATVAGIRKLVERGVIEPSDDEVSVVGVLTGHVLKDPDATTGYHNETLDGINPAYPNAPVQCEPTPDAVRRAIDAG